MKKIASFEINHDLLNKGMYISRIDNDIITYDIRMKKPNNPKNDYITPAGGHTIEHLWQPGCVTASMQIVLSMLVLWDARPDFIS